MNAPSNCVGFFMETSFHYEVYRNIIAGLLSRNIPCELVVNDMIEPGFVNEMIAFLNQVRMPGLTCVALSSALKSNRQYACLVSPYYIDYFEKLSSVHVRTVYGLAKNEWNHAAWNTCYNYILCYSHYTKESLGMGDKSIVIGNPRFDDWHNKTYSNVMPEYLHLDTAKPTLLYAPTYGVLSSLPHWAEKLSRLRHDYNIITKLHHGTLYRESEKNTLKTTRRFLKNITHENNATFALLEQADFVITDNSGFIFDAINADKKVILLNWPGMDNLLVNQASYSTAESPEQTVRDFLPVAHDMQDLRRYLSPEYPWNTIDPQLQHIKNAYCDAFNDGMAGLRAAMVIIEAVHEAAR